MARVARGLQQVAQDAYDLYRGAERQHAITDSCRGQPDGRCSRLGGSDADQHCPGDDGPIDDPVGPGSRTTAISSAAG